MTKYEQAHQEHFFEPIFNAESKILILRTFPSVKSRENQFYYGHPQNRFWKVLAALYKSESFVTIEEKKMFLLKNQIAIWDVIASCDITGSSDSSIKNVVSKISRTYCEERDYYTSFYQSGQRIIFI